MSDEERIIYNTEEDQEWADLLSPARRKIIIGAGLTAAGLTAGEALAAGQEVGAPGGLVFKPMRPLYDYAWFVGFFASGGLYLVMSRRPAASTQASAAA